MPNYKLSYFNVRAMGEPIRLILHYAKQPFDDVRVADDEWKDLKPKTPYGQLPVLEVDGKEIAQSYAICRYLARKHGLAGKDDLEAAQVDSLADFMKDIGTDVRPWFVVALGREDGDKDKLEKDVLIPAVEKAFKKLEKTLNDAGSGFLVASGVTWVDFVLAERLHTFELLKPDILKPYPKIKEYLNRVYNLPQIKDYIESRPKSNV